MEFLSTDIKERIDRISEKTGISKEKFIEQMVGHVLGQLEAGGKMILDLETGKLEFGAPPPVLPATTGLAPPIPGNMAPPIFGVAVPADPNEPKSPRNLSRMTKTIPDDKDKWHVPSFVPVETNGEPAEDTGGEQPSGAVG